VKRGQFVTFEGPEGAGKSTQLKLLAGWLADRGIHPVITREPGGTPMGDRIREAMFGPHDHEIRPLTEAFLMNAARAQHVAEVLKPALDAGKLVLCDRYADATLAYQGYGHGLDLDMLRELIAIATGGLIPHLTIYLDVPVDVGLGRKRQAHGRGGELNHLDRMELTFHERVVAGYRALIEAEPARWRIVDANRPPADIQTDLRSLLEGLLSNA
jgi:dTMP kinase